MPKQGFESIKNFEEEERRGEEEREREIGEYYQRLRFLGEAFSRYGAYRIKIDPKAETFYFNHETQEVGVSTRLIEKLNLGPEERKWVLLHELGHLIQFFQSPEEYLKTFEISKKKGEERGEPYKKAYRNFFNVFADIGDNSIVRALMPVYQKGGEEESVPERLYKEKLFKEEDYTSFPHSQQFLYFLLRRRMVPSAPCKISPEVEKIISAPFLCFGEKYNSLEEFVEEQIANPIAEFRDLFFYATEFLLPIYEKLLAEDERKGRLSDIPDFLGEFDMDSGLGEETLRKIKEQIGESKKSPDKKYQDYLKKELEKAGREKGFSEREIERMVEIQEETHLIQKSKQYIMLQNNAD